MSLPTNPVHALLLTWNHAAAFYNTFYVCAKSGLGWSNTWLGPPILVLPGILMKWEAEDSKCLLLFLLWETRAQAFFLVLRRKKMLLIGEVVESWCSLLPLFSSVSGSFPPFHFHKKQQRLVLGFLLLLVFVVSIFSSICHPDTMSLTLSSLFCSSVDKKWDL